MDKIKKNKTLVFLIVITVVAFIFGTLFITILNNSDKQLVKTYIETFLNDIYKNKINYISVLKSTLSSNIFLIVLIWLIGISVIGIPIIVFIYFFKAFSLGFTISSFIFSYKTKGILFSLLYIFPNEIIKYLCYTLLIMNAINLSKKIIYSVLRKGNLNFNRIINRYFKILILCLIVIVITSLYEVYGIPFIFNKFYFLIK